MSTPDTLVECLVDAATEAIRKQRPAIISDAGHLVSVTIELELLNGDDVVISTCWPERHGVHRRKKEPAG